MTGYGRAARMAGAHHVTVEIRSVNHRYLELKLRGASLPGALEEAVSARLRTRFERGTVTVTVAVRSEHGGGRLDRGRARRVFGELAELATELGVAPPTLAEVLAQPGVLAAESSEGLDDAVVLELVEQASAGVLTMRAQEGRALAAEVERRLAALAAIAAEVSELAAQAAPQAAERLLERVRRVLAQLSPQEGADTLDPGRLAQEVALLVDRGDITEELVRLDSHLAQARALLAAGGALGRRLEFLLQEIGRELNTVGAKSWSAAISGRIVEGKSELEKLREQAQNVE